MDYKGSGYLKRLLGSKVLIIILSVAIMESVFIIPAYLLYRHIEKIVIEEAQKSAVDLAAATAKFIEEDIGSYMLLSKTADYSLGNYDSAYYERMQALFRKIKAETAVAFIYTEKQISETELAYILDGEDPESDLFSPLGSKDFLTAAELKVLREKTPAASGIVQDAQWGGYLAGFAPIIDHRTGELAGLVGVDYPADYIDQVNNGVLFIILLFSIILILPLVVILNRLLNMRNMSMYTDCMTGLFNKSYYDQFLAESIRKVRAKGGSLSVIIIDVNDFKQVNDTFGHTFGDGVLMDISKSIKENTRSMDISCRYGGDEFAVILPDTSLKDATVIGKRIEEKIREKNYVKGHHAFRISVSMGVYEWLEDMSAEELTDVADQLMYAEKKAKGIPQIHTDDD